MGLQLQWWPGFNKFESDMTKSTEKMTQESTLDPSSFAQFDMVEFEQRLAGADREFHEKLKLSVMYKEPVQGTVTLNFNIPEAPQSAPKKIQKHVTEQASPQSNLLASLALEAQKSQQNKNTVNLEKEVSDSRVHDALERVLAFFLPFIQHVNTVEPAINRTYRLDAHSVFTNLKWQGALVDTRKNGLNDSALRSYVAFSVNLLSPDPVLLKRPWAQFEALVKELNHFKISTLDDLHAIHKRQKHEWLEARLDPALPVQILFRGNYALGKIDVLTRNLEDFGQTAFRLQPAEISPALLDELGMFLIARSDNLPAIIRDTPK